MTDDHGATGDDTVAYDEVKRYHDSDHVLLLNGLKGTTFDLGDGVHLYVLRMEGPLVRKDMKRMSVVVNFRPEDAAVLVAQLAKLLSDHGDGKIMLKELAATIAKSRRN